MWDRLSECGKPVVIYGMGNGADKIADRLLSKGIEVSDFFASDGFVRGQSFRGKTVLSFNDIKEKYKDFVILVAFATRLREVLDVIYELDEKYVDVIRKRWAEFTHGEGCDWESLTPAINEKENINA